MDKVVRIISGIKRGTKLLSPIGQETRPTLDRVKESMFNIIYNHIEDSLVLDIFSGTGSLGLESLSRGAKHCYFVDKGEETFKILNQNIVKLGFENISTAINTSAENALKMFVNKNLKFNLVFIDPPYLKNMIPYVIEYMSKNDIFDENGLIVTKIDSSEEIYMGNEVINLFDKRKYGNTTICFYRHN